MKTVIISTSDMTGGAARAAYSQASGLRHLGEDVTMCVQRKFGTDEWVLQQSGKINKILNLFRPFSESIPLKRYPQNNRGQWSLNWMPNPGLANRTNSLKPDIIHLHWIGGGFFPINQLQNLSSPIVWSMHDMWAFTGGCHYDNFCGRFTAACGSCPQLDGKEKDLSQKIFKKKKKLWDNVPITFVAASQWMATEIKRSNLFSESRVEVIPNGIDLQIFKPINKTTAREILGLPTNGNYLLFGAMGIGSISGTGDTRKGFQYLVPALKRLAASGNYHNLNLIIYGSSAPKETLDLGFPIHFIGRVHDETTLVLINSAADVTLVPSVQETFGLVATESMACGTPVVAFGATGLLDIIDHQINGYLAAPYDEKDFAYGITWLLDDDQRRQAVASAARQKCLKEYELKSIAKKFVNLYEEIL